MADSPHPPAPDETPFPEEKRTTWVNWDGVARTAVFPLLGVIKRLTPATAHAVFHIRVAVARGQPTAAILSLAAPEKAAAMARDYPLLAEKLLAPIPGSAYIVVIMDKVDASPIPWDEETKNNEGPQEEAEPGEFPPEESKGGEFTQEEEQQEGATAVITLYGIGFVRFGSLGE